MRKKIIEDDGERRQGLVGIADELFKGLNAKIYHSTDIES